MQPLERLADGTVRQVNPFSGTEVWTVPGRGNRPLPNTVPDPQPITARDHTARCAFCSDRYLETTPELARWDVHGRMRTGLTAEEVTAEPAAFRRFGNLFEILSFDYWRANHGIGDAHGREFEQHYTSTEQGRAHVRRMVQARLAASGRPGEPSEQDLHDQSRGFFAANHDVIAARRHFVDGATRTDQLASSGTLSPKEHRVLQAAVIETVRRHYEQNPAVKYVSAFQNWLAPAGASFEHLHKQIVSIDTYGHRLQRELDLVAAEPDVYRRLGVDLARQHDLVIAENEHAVAFAGIGHRYPGIDVYTKVAGLPWELPPEVISDWSDLVHACHVVTGPLVPVNEEWHHQPPGLGVQVPLRAVLKWRINTPAGFEGGTGIFVNTIDPWTVRDRAKAALEPLVGTDDLGRVERV